MTFLTDGLLSIILWLDSFIHNLGVTTIVFTLIFRSVLLAFTWKSLKAMHKMKVLAPEIKKLQQQYKNDPQALNLAQLELYKKYNVNPLSGCLPQLLQIFMLITFYRVLIKLFNLDTLDDTTFLWFDVTTPDSLHIIPILAAGSQFFLSLMTAPGGETRDIVPNDSQKKSIQTLNKKEEDTAEMAATMQRQMLFMMPFMTGLIAWTLPAGLGLYWVTSTIFSIVQQYFISGWGGIVIYSQRLRRLISARSATDSKKG